MRSPFQKGVRLTGGGVVLRSPGYDTFQNPTRYIAVKSTLTRSVLANPMRRTFTSVEGEGLMRVRMLAPAAGLC